MAESLHPSRGDTLRRLNGLGMAGLALGFLGLFFFFFPPLGVILSVGGLVLSIAGWAMTMTHAWPRRNFALGGTFLSLIALGINLLLLWGGFARLFGNAY